MILNPRIAHLLQESLGTRADPGAGDRGKQSELLRRAIAITREVHRGMAPTLLLEERVNALAVGGEPAP